MKIAVIGVGAIGSVLAARLYGAGERVTLVDTLERSARLRERGLSVRQLDGSLLHIDGPDVFAPGRYEPHDLVFLATKAHDLVAALPALESLLAAHTTIVPMQNGLPWWYFHAHGGPLDGTPLHSVDPGGILSRRIDPARIVGCVTYPAAELRDDGVARHVEGNALPLGELDGRARERTAQVADLLTRAGFKARVLERIRDEIWLKALGNLSFNPLSALTRATLDRLCEEPLRPVVTAMMQEAEAVATRLGVVLRVSIERRIEGAARVGAHKTSMLQDLERGRPLEIEALLGTVVEVAQRVGQPVPTLELVQRLIRQLDLSRGSTSAAAA